MNTTHIKTDGYCIDKLIKRIETKLGRQAANNLKQTATNVVQNCVDVYTEKFGAGDVGAEGTGLASKSSEGEIIDGTTGLIYGRVQSGKTNTTIATLAMAQSNGFRCFIVLTSDNTWLGKQTANRFNNQLKGGPIVFDWEKWKKDPNNFVESQLRPYIKDTGVVLVSTKNSRHLDKLLQVVKIGKIREVPTLIFDDEADNASLNTQEAKQAKKGKYLVPDSPIFTKIGNIRKEVANHIYIQITATPQSLLLQSLEHPCKPAFCAALPQPGQHYMGGDLFFGEDTPYVCRVSDEEVQQLKKQKGSINPGRAWEIPDGLRLALCCFFLGSMYKMQTADYEDEVYTFLAHICYKKDNHRNLDEIISNFVINLDQCLRGKGSMTSQKQAREWLSQAYIELNQTTGELPSLDNLIEELKHELRGAIPQVVNANNPEKQPNYNPGMNILIGGNRLGRGVTIEGLMVTYYVREAKQKMMDTVHQHARMYGYREHLKDVTRLFVSEQILEDFRTIHEADEGMRQTIGEDPNKIHFKPVWAGRSPLKPTKSNVLNPAEIDAFRPGKEISPSDPLWKTSEIKYHTKKLDDILQPYQGEKEYHRVDVDFMIDVLKEMPSRSCDGSSWEDRRVQEALRAMKKNGIEKGILNVRRGAKGEGLKLNNKKRPWRGPFATSQWISHPKRQYPDMPTLVVMYQKGERSLGWDDQPIYLPTLIFPKSKFIFMFNNAESFD